ncbi:MAG: acyl--CoA ligase [Mycoplasmoidaceae bacterium]|nr:acyl--CoA ligase [Mycoplasmoidaceae bacterium]
MTNTSLKEKMLNHPIVKGLVNITNVTQLLHHIKKQYGKDEAVIKTDGTKKTFNDLYNDVLIVANNLKKYQGNIGLFAPNGYEFEVIALATMATGKMVVCLPAQLNKDQLFGCCHKFDITVLCYDTKLMAASTVNVNKVDIASLFEDHGHDDILVKDINDKAPACLLLTGGTTGAPKGVVLSHTAIMRGMMNGCYGLDIVYKQRYYCMIPLTHSFGFIRNMLTALYTGSVIYYNQDKMAMFKELATFKPTVLIIVPAIAELFLSLVQSRGHGVLGGQVHTIICGSANVPQHLSLEF